MADLSVRAVAEASWRTWLRDFWALTALAACLELPLLAADAALRVTPGLRALVDDSVTVDGALLLVMVYGTLSHHFLAGLLERVVAVERHGHPRPSLRQLLRHLPWRRLVLADLLLTAVVTLGLIALVVPGLVALTWFAVVLPIVNLERRPVLASFARSYQLVRGYSWRVGLVATTAFVVPEVVVGLSTAVAHRATDDVVPNMLAHAIPAVLLMPLAALPIVILAFDLVALHDAAPARSG